MTIQFNDVPPTAWKFDRLAECHGARRIVRNVRIRQTRLGR